MGYYKQQEIAGQVEQAHRPKGVSVHVAWPTRREVRELHQVLRKATRENQRRAVVAKTIITVAVLLTVANVLVIVSAVRGA
jgi:hypothetical protein